MAKSDLASRRAEQRAESQINRILDAAEASFIASGFHAATMADIATRAGMSAGLSYRYFKCKRDIVLAIIARQLQRQRDGMRELGADYDIGAKLAQVFAEPENFRERLMNSSLFLETSAEASRDDAVAAAIVIADRTLRSDISAWLSRSRVEDGIGIDPGRAMPVALLLQCLLDGLEVRRAREPDLDRALLESMLSDALPRLLTD